MSELDHIISQIPFAHLEKMLAGLDALDAAVGFDPSQVFMSKVPSRHLRGPGRAALDVQT